MELLNFAVERREVRGKGSSGRLRRSGRLPGIVYGPGMDAVSVSVEEEAFSRSLFGLQGAHLIQLRSADTTLDGRQVLVRDVQVNPLTGRAEHVDFYAAPLDRRIEVSVALHFEGKAAGVGAGGILQPLLRELHLQCLPTAIPDAIVVDVTELGVHDTLHISQIQLPEGVTPVGSEDLALVTVLPPTIDKRAEEAATPAAAAGAAATPEAGKKPAS